MASPLVHIIGGRCGWQEMNLLTDYAVYPKSPSWVSGRGGLRSKLPQWELGLQQEEILLAI